MATFDNGCHGETRKEKDAEMETEHNTQEGVPEKGKKRNRSEKAKIRNRESAAKSRQMKLDYIQELEQKLHLLREENKRLNQTRADQLEWKRQAAMAERANEGTESPRKKRSHSCPL